MADAVVMLCHAIKQAAPKKLSVAFYGYPFEVAPAPAGIQSSGHLALGRLLNSSDVDVLCSPVSYLDRAPGGGGYFMAPVDSVQLHGKLWLVEDDTRTHLSAPDSGYGRTSDERQTRGVLARNFGHIVTRGSAVWWMDLPGQGWFAGDDMWQYLSGLQRAYSVALAVLSVSGARDRNRTPCVTAKSRVRARKRGGQFMLARHYLPFRPGGDLRWAVPGR